MRECARVLEWGWFGMGFAVGVERWGEVRGLVVALKRVASCSGWPSPRSRVVHQRYY